MKTALHNRFKKCLKLFFLGVLLCGGVCFLAVIGINWYILDFTKAYIFQELDQIDSRQCAMILGARVYDSGSISHVVRDRAESAMELYHHELADKVLISGDHGQRDYDEVNAFVSILLRSPFILIEKFPYTDALVVCPKPIIKLFQYE